MYRVGADVSASNHAETTAPVASVMEARMNANAELCSGALISFRNDMSIDYS